MINKTRPEPVRLALRAIGLAKRESRHFFSPNMLRKFSGLLLCLSLLLTSGCVTKPDNSVAAERLMGANRVGVLTLTSPSMHGKLVATTAFGNAAWESPESRLTTADWVFDAVAKTISRPAVRVDEKLWAQVRPLFRPRFLSSSPKVLPTETVQQMGKETGVQILLVFSSSISSDFLTMTNQAMEAQGLFSRRFFGKGDDYAYFVATIEVYDTRDGKRLKEIWCAHGGLIGEQFEWRDTWVAYPAQEQRALITAVAQTTTTAVKQAIAQTNL